MAYKEFQPSKNLQKYVDSYWYFANEDSCDVEYPILPDGCMDIIFPLLGDNRPFVVGIMTKAETVSIKPEQRMFGIRFKPAIAPSLLKIPAVELKDATIPLEFLNKKMASEIGELTFKQQVPNHVELFDKKIANLLNNAEINEKVVAIVSLVTKQQGNTSLSDAAREVGTSLRHMERLFKHHIGVSPKRFARIIRFHQSHIAMSESDVLTLASMAYRYGYADQAHFNKDYKNFTGVNPTHRSMSHFYNK
jgi:AraC-like DNA-binding protein